MFESDAAKKFFDTKLLLKMLDDHKNGKNTNEKTDNSRKIRQFISSSYGMTDSLSMENRFIRR